MERPSFHFSPFVDVKPRNLPQYPPPLSPGVKHPITPTPRVPVIKPTSSYRIDDILSKPDPRPPVPVPTDTHYRTYLAVPPPRRYGYGPNVPLLWSAMLQSQWRERFNGTLHVSLIFAFPTYKGTLNHSQSYYDQLLYVEGLKLLLIENTFKPKYL